MATETESTTRNEDQPAHQLRFDDLPYAGDHADRDIVIFDGDCRFCLKSVRQLKWFDRRGDRLAYVSLHDPMVAEEFPNLTHEQMMDQMFVVDTTGKSHGGAAALRYLSRRLPLLWLAAPVLHIPFSLPVWRTLYRWVANRRYKIAGKTSDEQCEGSCSVHFDK